ncbi:MAG: class I SAM-dependent methyltransferase, partial [Alphaproteobacteria bacterium]
MKTDINDKIRAEAPVDAYDAMYEGEGGYDLPYQQSIYYPMYQATLQEVVRVGAKNVLEVGCGSGSFAQMLFDCSDVTYSGFDFSSLGVEKAKVRTGKPTAFHVANALEPESYGADHDAIVCTEVLEHIEKDCDVVAIWETGVKCICAVPNFDFETHVRYFRSDEEVHSRYNGLIDIERIIQIPRPLLRGRSLRQYLRQLRWSRNEPKKMMAMLGYKTFENLAGWFV